MATPTVQPTPAATASSAQLALALGDVLPQPPQRQRIDAGIVIRRRGAKRLAVGIGGALQGRGGIAGRGARVGLALRMRVPDLRPLVLPGAGEEALRLAVLVLLGERAQHIACLGVTFRATKRHALELARLDVVRVELFGLFQDAQRIERPFQVQKRLGRRRAAPRIPGGCWESLRPAPGCRPGAAFCGRPRRAFARFPTPPRTR